MKLTVYLGRKKPLVAVGKNQCRLLAFAEKHRGWHSFNQKCRTTRAAIAGLKRRKCIQVKGDQFRLVE